MSTQALMKFFQLKFSFSGGMRKYVRPTPLFGFEASREREGGIPGAVLQSCSPKTDTLPLKAWTVGYGQPSRQIT